MKKINKSTNIAAKLNNMYQTLLWKPNDDGVLLSKNNPENVIYYINSIGDEFELIMKNPTTEKLEFVDTFPTISMAKLEAEICNFSNAQKNNPVDKKIILELNNQVNKNEDIEVISLWLKTLIYINNYKIVINKCTELNCKTGGVMASPITGSILGKITEIH